VCKCEGIGGDTNEASNLGTGNIAEA
jgi:hypothetical protein